MVGFLIGTVCLIGLFKVAFGGCHRGWHGRSACGGYGGRHRGRFVGGFGERSMLRWLFERLDTTHGQEKVILEAVEDLKEPLRNAREDWRSTFGDLARAIRGDEFDHGGVAGTWVRQDKSLEQLRLALTTALTRVHDALDERQRRVFAEIIERGPGFRGELI